MKIFEEGKCCFCGKSYGQYGNNPYPFYQDNEEARCCDECNLSKVIPARLGLMKGGNSNV